MFKYKVLGYKTSGNAKHIYEILDLETGEILHKYAGFFKEKGDSAFINVSVRSTGFSVLRADKGTPEYEKNYCRFKNK